ncbi:LuxR family transcriptional regulator [Actinoplanes sp. L3-i22]|uniref:helix-turn-helix transcriptional regulator n=1 Tax=Actinoplanes sp. L3-i22 TaxID=2836373 RepID=UPI001C755936|nr:AAA family ATPase [Actinoplanes sp. L3-i22]BCY13140.1 transcriptional regulator [Actinoplanes sp. L3-i22]
MIGRERELARLRALVDPPPRRAHVHVLIGDPGLGKTAVLTGVARSAAMRTLAVTGRESEQDLAFAGLHQLLRPVLDRVPALPGRQARALLGAFALTDDPVPADALLTGLAVLTLLAALAEDGPLLVTVDDAQWLDAASLGALTFAARRLELEPIVVLLATRDPAGLGPGLPGTRLEPLDPADAGRLLDAQPAPPYGPAREQVLAQAAGNPLALIELSAALAADPAAARRWAAEPLPLTDRLTALLAVRFEALPGPVRDTLLLAAVADSPEVAARVTGPDRPAPAERAGLIRIDAAGLHFTHPLTRAAVYHAVPFAERAAAHRRVAETVRDQPDRYAWHLAAAAGAPDETVAARLEESAAHARRRGGAAAAARVLERAAALSPSETDQVRRLLAAAGHAQAAGQGDWVRDLAGRVLTRSAAEPAQRLAARQRIGWAQVWSGEHATALDTLLSVAGAAAPATAWSALAFAATLAHRSGTPGDRGAVLRALDRMPGPGGDEARLWVRACAEAPGEHASTRAELHRIAVAGPRDRTLVGSAAWLLEETDLAVRLLRQALAGLREPGMRGGSGGVLTALPWACFDSGRWDEALSVAREARDAAAAYRMDPVAASADLCVAAVRALRGEDVEVGAHLANADAMEYRAATARARHVAGLAAFARGAYPAAYAQLRHLFDDDGEPLHHRVSYLGIADLAAAAVRTGRPFPRPALAPLDAAASPRLRQLAARARGLLGEAIGEPEPAGEQWPFEHAQLRLDQGERLRRERRINDAKPVLAEALETFQRLRAAPWARRAEAELRACGVAAAPAAPDKLAGLTTQQREIVVLAARGLTNAEIADRLFLSPRTVASHLYRSYPKLGVAGRHQLRDLVPER